MIPGMTFQQLEQIDYVLLAWGQHYGWRYWMSGSNLMLEIEGYGMRRLFVIDRLGYLTTY